MVLVNTCGFIQAAKQESIDELLSAAESGVKVAAVGCLAERYGAELRRRTARGADPQLRRLRRHRRPPGRRAGRQAPARAHRAGPPHPAAHQPRRPPGRAATPSLPSPRPVPAPCPVDRRPIRPGPGCSGAERLSARRWLAPLKIASGCDRRCSFCAIPSFRGAFVSRRPPEILAEARWLAASGVRELLLVSENSTSYGKDLGNLRLLEERAAGPGRDRRHRPGQDQLPAARRAAARA